MKAQPMLKTEAAPDEPSDAVPSAKIPPFAKIGLDHFAPYLFNRISARWNVDLQGELREHGLTTLQMRVLAILSVMPGATVNELSVYSVTEQSTMSRTLDGMERDGLVRRMNRPGDMRVREVHPTAKGLRAFERVWPVMHRSLRKMFAGISDEEYNTLVALMTRVLRNIRRHEF
jgi:MarR family transcriptional regulator, transcriptional regulator for hemolysin